MALRILNHDYGGYAFIVQLSRSLAGRGHDVLHAYSASFQGPHEGLVKQESDPERYDVVGVRLKEPFQKHSFIKRRQQEVEYGRLVAAEIERWKPDIVISGNTATEPQRLIERAAHRQGARFVFWVQDVYGVAVQQILSRSIPVLGSAIGLVYQAVDRSVLRRSDSVVLITEDFQPLMDRWGIDRQRTHVVQNWAPLDSIRPHPKVNPWSRQHGLDDKLCLLYSGTLGMKHNPDALLQLALRFRNDDRVRVVVVSEGPGADWLRSKKEEHGIDALLIVDWQPYEVLSEVLASADILLAILEPYAGIFSVPSKVLSYFCARRAVLLSVPPENLAARIVCEHQAGLVVPSGDVPGFVEAAAALIGDEAQRERMAGNARRYAETHFDIGRITDRFEKIIRQASAV